MSPKKQPPDEHVPLTSAVFYLLLALYEGERHGYELMKRVALDSGGALRMGPGTLYGSIKRMLQKGLIREVGEAADSELGDDRRRYYRLTETGRASLKAELQRFASALSVASGRNLSGSRLLRKVRSAMA